MIYHEDVFAVFVEAVILQEGGRGRRGALLACAKGSSLRILALVDLCFDIPSTVKIII